MVKRTGQKAPAGNKAKAASARPLHPVQWIVGLGSALLTAALIGFVFYRALVAGDGVPDLSVRVTHAEPLASGAGTRLSFVVENRGEATASGVVVHAEIGGGEGEAPSAGGANRTVDVTLDYVPALSEATGAFIVEDDPARVPVTLSVGGYSDP